MGDKVEQQVVMHRLKNTDVRQSPLSRIISQFSVTSGCMSVQGKGVSVGDSVMSSVGLFDGLFEEVGVLATLEVIVDDVVVASLEVVDEMLVTIVSCSQHVLKQSGLIDCRSHKPPIRALLQSCWLRLSTRLSHDIEPSVVEIVVMDVG